MFPIGRVLKKQTDARCHIFAWENTYSHSRTQHFLGWFQSGIWRASIKWLPSDFHNVKHIFHEDCEVLSKFICCSLPPTMIQCCRCRKVSCFQDVSCFVCWRFVSSLNYLPQLCSPLADVLSFCFYQVNWLQQLLNQPVSIILYLWGFHQSRLLPLPLISNLIPFPSYSLY